METAYVDLLEVCTMGGCGHGHGACNPNVHIAGHTDEGGDVAFLLVLRLNGKVLAHSLNTPIFNGAYRDGLLSQQGDGFLTTSEDNPGPPWGVCEFHVHTGGAGGYALNTILGGYRLRGSRGITYTLEAYASPVEWQTMPDGSLLRRVCLQEWNWEAGKEVPLRIYQRGYGYKCDAARSGEMPTFEKPEILDIEIGISGDDEDEGCAHVEVSFKTSVPAEAQVYFALQMEGQSPGGELEKTCDPFSMWRSGISQGFTHTLTLPRAACYYSKEQPKDYCLKVVAWIPSFRWIAKAYSEKLSFTL